MFVDIIKKGLVLSCCFGLLACSSSDSDDGNGINAIIEVTADGVNGTNVKATMLTGSNGSASTQVVDIASGDLNAFANNSLEVPQVMVRIDNGSQRDTYEADFLGDALTTEFEVQYTTAPSSTAFLPMGFEITPPAADSTWNDLTLNVELVNDAAYPNAGDATMTIRYQIDCPDAKNEPVVSISDVAFDFLVTLPIDISLIQGGLLLGTVNTAVDTCTVDIELERSIAGTLDPNYANGSITGIQTRTQTYTIKP